MIRDTEALEKMPFLIESKVPTTRVKNANSAGVNAQGDYVLYWMTAFRRSTWNFSLQRAVDWCNELGKPLLVFEALRNGYEWASDRLHAFVIEGMMDNSDSFAKRGITYFPYLEIGINEGKGLLKALSENACVVVTDDFPCFFLPRMLVSAAKQTPVLMETVDSNGIIPLDFPERSFATAFSFRIFLQKNLFAFLEQMPESEPLNTYTIRKKALVPELFSPSWKPADLAESRKNLNVFPIDHKVSPVDTRGGNKQAENTLDDFLENKLDKYAELRNHPDDDATSNLSPYLHFGHVASHQVVYELLSRRNWIPDPLSKKPKGSRAGWWGLDESAEGFLDQIITWRELGYNACRFISNYDKYESLPAWALKTLEDHRGDIRNPVYSLDQLENAETYDDLWNAAQRQLVVEGRLHNYMRMLWGKKILEWSRTPEQALNAMIHLNNKYALDGRNPNSYSGIFWTLGKYDRPWGPERPVFGKIRYMSSENTKRKVRVKEWMRRSGTRLANYMV